MDNLNFNQFIQSKFNSESQDLLSIFQEYGLSIKSTDEEWQDEPRHDEPSSNEPVMAETIDDL